MIQKTLLTLKSKIRRRYLWITGFVFSIILIALSILFSLMTPLSNHNVLGILESRYGENKFTIIESELKDGYRWNYTVNYSTDKGSYPFKFVIYDNFDGTYSYGECEYDKALWNSVIQENNLNNLYGIVNKDEEYLFRMTENTDTDQIRKSLRIVSTYLAQQDLTGLSKILIPVELYLQDQELLFTTGNLSWDPENRYLFISNDFQNANKHLGTLIALTSGLDNVNEEALKDLDFTDVTFKYNGKSVTKQIALQDLSYNPIPSLSFKDIYDIFKGLGIKVTGNENDMTVTAKDGTELYLGWDRFSEFEGIKEYRATEFKTAEQQQSEYEASLTQSESNSNLLTENLEDEDAHAHAHTHEFEDAYIGYMNPETSQALVSTDGLFSIQMILLTFGYDIEVSYAGNTVDYSLKTDESEIVDNFTPLFESIYKLEDKE